MTTMRLTRCSSLAILGWMGLCLPLHGSESSVLMEAHYSIKAHSPSYVNGLSVSTSPLHPKISLRLRGGTDAMVDDIFPVEDIITPEEKRALESSNIVVPSTEYTTVSDAFQHARAPEERRDGRALDFDEEDFEGRSVFIKRGVHNISTDPEITLCKAIAVTGQTGAVFASYAAPRKDNLSPDYGGGRLRLEDGASGSVFRGLEWWCDNVQCAIVEGAAVLFSGCTIKCNSGAYVSCVWGLKGAHISMVNCTVGGFDKSQQATYGVVASGCAVTLQDCLLRCCSGSAIAVENNSSARIARCRLLDSYAAISMSDGRLHDGPSKVAGSVELLNSTVKCVNGIWRDDDLPVHYVHSGVEVLAQDYPEFADRVGNPYPTPKMEWNEEREEWEYAGASEQTLHRIQEYYDKYRSADDVNMTALRRRVRSEHRAEWESSEDEGAGQLVPHMPLSFDAEATDAKDVAAFDVRHRGTGAVLRDLRPRYKNAHGHEGLPPRPRNRHFAGIQKHPRIKRAGRHTYKRS